MAKYTELLSEYLEEGGQLPALFDTIEGFRDLFIGEYCDREIGFETPTLFTLKLEHKASLVIPLYSKRIADLKAMRELVLNPNKKRLRTGNLTRTRTGEMIHTDGETNVTTTNTKAGSQITTDKGKDTTSAPDGTSATIETTKQYDAPYATQNNSQPPLIQPQQVTEVSRPVSLVQKENTNTVTYPDYEDKTVQTGQQTQSTDSFNNYEEAENYNDITDTEEGFSPSEALAIQQHFEQDKTNILEECLAEFDNLFMGIY